VPKIGTSPSDLDLFLPKAARGPTRASAPGGPGPLEIGYVVLTSWVGGRRRPRRFLHI